MSGSAFVVPTGATGPTGPSGIKGGAQVSYQTGNVTFNTTSWAAMSTGTFDVSCAAAVGDTIMVSLNTEGDGGAAVVAALLDFHTLVSGSRINSLSTKIAVANTNLGVPSLRINSAVATSLYGSVFYKLVSGDISSGSVTVRLVGRQFSGSMTATLYGGSTLPIEFTIVNLGVVL